MLIYQDFKTDVGQRGKDQLAALQTLNQNIDSASDLLGQINQAISKSSKPAPFTTLKPDYLSDITAQLEELNRTLAAWKLQDGLK